MTSGYHSIWLMPRAEDERTFETVVRALAARFDSPVFQPHLTLVEDMPRACEDLEPVLARLADGVRRFQSSVDAVEESPLYYRSLYARFAVDAPLRSLKEKAVGLFGVGSLGTFVPHVSLAYGVPESPDKTHAVAALRRDLQGMALTFDRICIVASSQNTPIEQWAIRRSVPLLPA